MITKRSIFMMAVLPGAPSSTKRFVLSTKTFVVPLRQKSEGGSQKSRPTLLPSALCPLRRGVRDRDAQLLELPLRLPPLSREDAALLPHSFVKRDCRLPIAGHRFSTGVVELPLQD